MNENDNIVCYDEINGKTVKTILGTKIKSIKKIGHGRVINLTVHKNHTFITENGIITHNCDSMSSQNMAGFRAFLDEFSQNCRFIFTGNYKEKIIQPLLDRLINIDFNTFDKKQMVVPIFERLKYILENEYIQYSKEDIKKVILTYYPRIRSMVGALQRYSIDGVLKISEDQLNDLSEFDKIMQFVSAKDYQNMIQGVNALTSPENMYSFLYKHAEKYFNSKYPTAIVTIARYQFMSSSVRDKALNLSACLTELMNL